MNSFNLDFPILSPIARSGEKNSTWNVRHAVEGVQIFGGIGSGKTSGSGRMLALKYLEAGFGGLVLTVKPDEKQVWQEYCQLTGREKDLIILEPGGEHSFNFLDYESRNSEGEEAITENIVEVLKTVISAGEAAGGGSQTDPFWDEALDMLLFNVIDLCKMAYGELSVQTIYNIVCTLPKASEKLGTEEFEGKAFYKAFGKVKNEIIEEIDEIEAWLKRSQGGEDVNLTDEEIEERIPRSRLFQFLDQFFIDNFRTLSDKTRSILDLTFSSFLYRLLREPVYSLFCKNKSTVTPDDSLKGKIILLNLPVKKYHKVGRDCQILFKYIWQRAMEQRKVEDDTLPVFLWADEAQNFLHEHDTDYQATARSSRIATVYITQNLPNYFARMGGQHAEYRVKSFLGTLGTKIFHANADMDTNRYASELIGDDYFINSSSGHTVSKDFSLSANESVILERIIRPEAFVGLRTGGPNNNYKVDGYLHKQGDPINGNANYLLMPFNQKYKLNK